MKLEFINNSLHLLIILPLLLLFFKEGKLKENWKILLIFIAFYQIYGALLVIPIYFPSLRIIDGSWNWNGKIFAITGSLIFMIFYLRKEFEHHFLTFRQRKGSLKLSLLVLLISLSGSLVIAYFLYSSNSEFVAEDLLFQLTMPGLDEEFAYRGVMMVLLGGILQKQIKVGKLKLGHPAVLITAILFGCVHAFGFNSKMVLSIDWMYFAYTFLFGLLLGWVAVRSRSVVWPVIIHSLAAFAGLLLPMIR